MQIISACAENTPYTPGAQQNSRGVLWVAALLRWAESNLPSFEYLVWE